MKKKTQKDVIQLRMIVANLDTEFKKLKMLLNAEMNSNFSTFGVIGERLSAHRLDLDTLWAFYILLLAILFNLKFELYLLRGDIVFARISGIFYIAACAIFALMFVRILKRLK